MSDEHLDPQGPRARGADPETHARAAAALAGATARLSQERPARWWQIPRTVWLRVGSCRSDREHDRRFHAACTTIITLAAHPCGAALARGQARGVERAVRLLRSVVDYRPVNAAAWWFLGMALRLLGRLEDALAAQRVAYAIDSTRADIGRELVLTCMALGRSQEALQTSGEVIDIHPADAGLIANHALALLLCGDDAKAQWTVRHARSLDPDDAVTLALEGVIEAVASGEMARPDRWPPAGWSA